MGLTRAGGVVAACAIHGLLLAVVPPETSLQLTSSVSQAGNTALSVSFQSFRPPVAAEPKSTPQPVAQQSVVRSEPRPQPKAKKVAAAVLATNKEPAVNKEKFQPTTQASAPQPVKEPDHQGLHPSIITEPLFAQQPLPPLYPNLARKRGQQGTVWVDVLLDKTGRQTHVAIYQSSGVSPLDRAALTAVKQWLFIAHHINDIAVASHVRIPVEFSLD